METHALAQGTELWHEFRKHHYGSSETAAMLGISPFLTRNDLLLYKKTGKSKEYSDWVQANILDYGHGVEASARAIIEVELDEELYPVTCSDGNLSASCDGLTLDGHVAFEHKQWSESLVNYIIDNQSLPDSHMPQCQQILLVTGAKRVIFVCSDGTKENWCEIEVYPDQSWFDRIISGWSQFEKDLKTFVKKEVNEKPEPEAIMQLPALSIQIRGEVTVSNLPEFKEAAETFISNINTNLQTDEDFVKAEATIKFCDEVEKKIESAKAAAIGQTQSIDQLMRTMDFIEESIRSKRLTLTKLVKTQKDKIKLEAINNGLKKCIAHTHEIHSEFTSIDFSKLSQSIFSIVNFETACKNKRTIDSLHNAVDTEVASIKIKLDELARVVRKNLTYLPEDLSIFRDLQSIITKPEEDFKLLVESRLAEQKRKEEEAAIRAAEELKAVEERGISQALAVQERERIAKELEQLRIAEASERMKQIKEAETKRIESLPTEIKSVISDEEKQAKEIIKSINEEMIEVPKQRWFELIEIERMYFELVDSMKESKTA